MDAIASQEDGRAVGSRKRAWAACYGDDGRTRRRQLAKEARRMAAWVQWIRMAPVEVEATSKQAVVSRQLCGLSCRVPARAQQRRGAEVGCRPLVGYCSSAYPLSPISKIILKIRIPLKFLPKQHLFRILNSTNHI